MTYDDPNDPFDDIFEALKVICILLGLSVSTMFVIRLFVDL